MSQAIVTESKLVAIADAIRSVGSLSGSMTLDQMASAILSLSGGGGGGGGDIDAFVDGTISEVTTSASKVRDYCFNSASGLTKFIGTQVLSVGPNAFYACINLSTITLKMSRCGQYAFAYCSKLDDTGALFSNFTNQSSIAASAFRNCGFTSIDYPLSFVGADMFVSCSKLSYFNAPNIVTMSGSNAFSGCSYASGLTVSFPNLVSITNHNWGAFASCHFENLDFAAAFPKLSSVYNAFYLTYFASYVELPSLTFTSNFCFYTGTGGSYKMLKASFPMLKTVGQYCFGNNRSLSQIYMPNATDISDSAFQSCYLLESYHNSSYLSRIGNYAFAYCSKLSVLNLTSVSSVPTLGGTSAFRNSPMSNSSYLGYFGSIYVPASLYNAFITSTNWTTYSARITSDPVPA